VASGAAQNDGLATAGAAPRSGDSVSESGRPLLQPFGSHGRRRSAGTGDGDDPTSDGSPRGWPQAGSWPGRLLAPLVATHTRPHSRSSTASDRSVPNSARGLERRSSVNSAARFSVNDRRLRVGAAPTRSSPRRMMAHRRQTRRPRGPAPVRYFTAADEPIEQLWWRRRQRRLLQVAMSAAGEN
jgi:hypothetical protein